MNEKQEEKNEAVRIVLAEDSPSQAFFLKKLLEANNYRSWSAKDGKEALSMVREHRPSIVISDVLMPEMDGYELCRRVKQDEGLGPVSVILLTSLSKPEDVVKGLKSGADNFITKPFSEEFLLSRLDYILANQRLRKESIPEMGIEIFFAGEKHYITSNRMQIIDLLFSTYEEAVRKTHDLEKANQELTEALGTIHTLRELIPICAWCKKIRNDKGYWQGVEDYIQQYSGAKFTHGLCPACEEKELR